MAAVLEENRGHSIKDAQKFQEPYLDVPKGVDPKIPKVMIGIPVLKSVRPEIFYWCLNEQKKQLTGKSNYDIKIVCVSGKPQTHTGNLIINEFLESDCTHLLKLDSDLAPDKDLIPRLLKHDKDLIGQAVAIWSELKNKVKIVTCRGTHGHYTDPDYKKEPYGSCDFVGGGCVLIKRKVVQKVLEDPENRPFYLIIWGEHGFIEIGSDERMCMNVKKCGFEVWYDATVVLPQYSELLLATKVTDENPITKIESFGYGGKLGVRPHEQAEN